MELVILFVIMALMVFGPRRSGRMPGPFAMAVGAFFLLYMLAMFGMGWVWTAIFGHVSQP